MSGSIRARLRFARRWFLLGSGPLKRTSDRLQLAGRVIVVLSLLAAVPLAVLAAGLTRTRLGAEAGAQAATRHQVRAVVLADAGSAPSAGADSSATVSVVQVEVGWRAAGGAVRRASLLVPGGTTAGTTVSLWVDRAGHVTTAPLDAGDIGNNSVAVAVAVTAGVPMLVWGSYCGLCVVLDVRRHRRWGREWARVEREWRARQG